MSTSDRPAACISVPGFAGITVLAQTLGGVRYAGWPDELLAAGIINAAMVLPTGKHLRTPDGLKVSVARYWRQRDGAPSKFFQVAVRGAPELLLRWPGVCEARAAYERYCRWKDQRDQERQHPRVSHLRLVVDNTTGLQP